METRRVENTLHNLNVVKTSRIIYNISYNQYSYTIDKIKYAMLISYTPMHVVPSLDIRGMLLSDPKH